MNRTPTKRSQPIHWSLLLAAGLLWSGPGRLSGSESTTGKSHGAEAEHAAAPAKVEPPHAAPLNSNSGHTAPLVDQVRDSLTAPFEPAIPLPAEITASGNLLLKPVPPVTIDELRPWRTQVEGALKMRKEKNLVGAENTLIGILQADAPPVIQKECLKHLAQFAIEARQYSRAQQIYSQLVSRFPSDPESPEILFRQGMLFRQMGAESMALAKFYAVMSSAISIAESSLPRYQSLVLLAQTEIADTYYLQGKHSAAVEFFRKVLKLEHPEVNEALIRYKLVKSLAALERHSDVIAESELFVSRCAKANELAEVRFLLSESFRKVGRIRDALVQTLELLKAGQAAAAKDPETWAYWQQRTGNDLANQLYREGDYASALQVYDTLARLQDAPAWQLPAWYQMGLVYERLGHVEKAVETYRKILGRQSEVTNATAGLTLVFEMSKWRSENIAWANNTEKESRAAIRGVDLAESTNGAAPTDLSQIRRKP